MPGYVAMVAVVHALGGGLLAIKMIGVVAGGLAAGAVYGLARLLFGGAAAVVAGSDVRALARRDRGRERDRNGHAGGRADRRRRLDAGSRGGAAAARRAGALRPAARPGGLPARGRVAAGGARRPALSRARRGVRARHHAHARRLPHRRAGAAALGHPQQDPLRRVLPHRQPRRPHRAGRFQPELRRKLLPVAEPPVRGGDRLPAVRAPASRERSRRVQAGRAVGEAGAEVRARPARVQGRQAADAASGSCCTGRSTGRACCRRGAGRSPGSPPTAPASNASSTGSGTCSSPPCWSA